MPSQTYVSFLQIGMKRNEMETVVTGAPTQIRTDNLGPVRDDTFTDVAGRDTCLDLMIERIAKAIARAC